MGLLRVLELFRPSLGNYRGWLFLQCTKLIGIPIILAHVVLLTSGVAVHLGVALRFVIYAGSILLLAAVRILYDDMLQRRTARKMGAIPVPRVRGRWPGNIDVLLYILEEFETGYVLQSFQNLLDQHGVKTLNLRLLWSDLVRMHARKGILHANAL